METIFKVSQKNNIYYIIFDTPSKKVNVLDMVVMDELNIVLDSIVKDKSAKGIIFLSAKENIFIAGADISVINNIKNKQEGINVCKKGKDILGRIKKLGIPSLAAIDGACLGGGLEFALFCSYRIASDNPATKLGLPEVSLGILPGFGGTQTLPRLIGITKSLDLILTGKTIDALKAYKLGIIDKLVPQNLINEFAENFMQDIISNKITGAINQQRHNKNNSFLEKISFGRAIIFSQAKKQLLAKTAGNYPAPLRALDTVKKGMDMSIDSAFEIESDAFGDLVITNTCKNLIDIYFWSEKSKKIGKKEFTKNINSSGVLGAGVMGGGISQLISSKKINVRMKDIKKEALALGLSSAWKVYDGAVKRRKLTLNDAKINMFHISPTLDYSGFDKLDIVIEAVIEDINIKKKVFQELETKISDKTIIATNTSSISINKMAEELKHPERFVGLHFFNPVHLMPLIEIIPSDKTNAETLNTVINLSVKLGKMPVVVRDKEGFLVNRILMPYLNEASKLLDEGASIEIIDKVAKKFGMPMGPLELMDEIGMDVSHKVANIMENAFGARMKIANISNKVYEDKRFGKKIGKGFYIHKGKEKFPDQEYINKIRQNSNISINEEQILERMLYIMINESSLCLEEQIVTNPGDVDFSLVMGTGFPAFRGGIIKYADQVGANIIYNKLKTFEQKMGIAYTPSEKLKLMAEQKTKFYAI